MYLKENNKETINEFLNKIFIENISLLFANFNENVEFKAITDLIAIKDF